MVLSAWLKTILSFTIADASFPNCDSIGRYSVKIMMSIVTDENKKIV